MEDILKTFGLEWPKFISQVIIVLLVYFILSKYAFGPVLAMLDARRRRIAEGESNLKTIELEFGESRRTGAGNVGSRKPGCGASHCGGSRQCRTVRGQKTQEAIKEAQAIIEKAREASPVGA